MTKDEQLQDVLSDLKGSINWAKRFVQPRRLFRQKRINELIKILEYDARYLERVLNDPS